MATERAVHLEAATLQFVAAADPNRGRLEAEVPRQTRELQRLTIEAGTQVQANATPPCCPVCRPRLDSRHAVEPLAAVGRVLFGEDSATLNAWLEPAKRARVRLTPGAGPAKLPASCDTRCIG